MGISVAQLALLGIACLAVTHVFTLVKRAYYSELRHIPGPQYARWTQWILKLNIMKGTRTQYIHALHLKYGPFVRVAPNEVSVTDLEASRAIHRIGSGFLKSEWYTGLVGETPPGVFSMVDPKQHAQRRRLFAQAFSNSSVLSYESLIREKIDLAVAKIQRDARAANGDVLKWFTFMATDLIGQLSFGRSFDMLEQEQKNQYIADLETTMMISAVRWEIGPISSLAKYLPITALRKALQLNARLLEYGRQAIQNHKAFANSKEHSSTTTFFDRCAETASKGEAAAITETEMASEGSNLIVAGSDTTAVSLTYIVYNMLLPENRDFRARLLAEISDLPENASATELGSLPYLRAVIDEGLRLFGAAPGSLPRAVPAAGATLGGYFFPGGTTVATQAYTIHRDPVIYSDPERFYPDRWLNATQEMRDAFSPFGAGSRICLGIHLAMLELTMTIFGFFKRCPHAELSASTTPESMEIENFFLIAPKSHRCEIKM